MAPIGEGFFLDLENEEVLHIHEHMYAVLDDTARYRVLPEEVSGKDREAVLRLVMKRGFVRVRGDVHRVVAEFDAPLATALPVIEKFFREYGFIGGRPVCLKDHLLGRELSCPA